VPFHIAEMPVATRTNSKQRSLLQLCLRASHRSQAAVGGTPLFLRRNFSQPERLGSVLGLLA
jgi:hypothetical protein